MPRKHRNTHKLPKSLQGSLKYYAEKFEGWSNKIRDYRGNAAGGKKLSPRDFSMNHLNSAGACIERLLKMGAFPEVGGFLLPAYRSRRTNRMVFYYREIWANFVHKLRTGQYHDSYRGGPYLKTLKDDLRFVADRLLKEARSRRPMVYQAWVECLAIVPGLERKSRAAQLDRVNKVLVSRGQPKMSNPRSLTNAKARFKRERAAKNVRKK